MNLLPYLTETCFTFLQMPQYIPLMQAGRLDNTNITQSSLYLFNMIEKLPIEAVHYNIREKRTSLCAAPYETVNGVEVAAYSQRIYDGEDVPEEDSLAYYDLLLYKVIEFALEKEVSNELDSTSLVPLITTLLRNVPDLNTKILGVESDRTVLDLLLSNRFTHKQFQGILTCSQPQNYFQELFLSSNPSQEDPPIRKHFLTLTLFTPAIQIQIIKDFLVKFPNFKDLMLRIVPFYPLDVGVIDFLLSSGAQVVFEAEAEEDTYLSRERYLNLLPVLGESVISLKDDHIALLLQQIFFKFDHKIMQNYLNLLPESTRYAANEYLASLLLFNPSIQSNYLPIEDLIDHQYHLDLLSSGTPDLLAVVSLMHHLQDEEEILNRIKDFITNFVKKEVEINFEEFSKEILFHTIFFPPPPHSAGLPRKTLPDHKSSIKNFFLMCCKFNLNDSAFKLLLEFFVNWTEGEFYWTLKRGLMIADSSGFDVKIALLSKMIADCDSSRDTLRESYFILNR